MVGIIDGRMVSKKIREEIQEEVEVLKVIGTVPGLAVVIVGSDPASQTYVNAKEKAATNLGFYSVKHELSEEVSEEELLGLIEDLNQDDRIDGILVQLPLPKHIDENKVIHAISMAKDVDGFHPGNIGGMVIGEDVPYPCTPHGIIKLIEAYDIKISGKHVVVLGRSNIVGKPLAAIMLNQNATVTVCHSKTEQLKDITKTADILIAAVGSPNFVTADMVKEGAVVIDVGINRIETRLVGDVDFEAVKEVASFITPVPGGVGPMTITMLLYNTLKSAKRRGDRK